MAARSTRVTIRNQTNATLQHIDDSLEHGIWTDPLSPPAEIGPGATIWWQSESDGIATGTEGHARYAVVGSNDVITFHWDNPFVGANFYEQSVTGPFGIYFSGGTGNNTEAIYSLIPNTRVAVPGYLPSTHGFAFPNHWPAEHITSITLPDPFGDILIGNAAWGLCGGMSFASRDYFESGQWAPEQTTNPSGEGDPLFDYIVNRLAQSLNVGDVADFLKYADPIYPNTDDPTLGNGRDWVMAHIAFPGIRDVIDSGHPCPIGLVLKQLPSLTGMGHQVCVYAYQLTGQELVLWVYDPNSPSNDNITMVMDISRTDQALIDVSGTVNVPEHPICFFTQSYEQRDPVQPRRPAAAMDVFWVGPDGALGTTWENPQVESANWHPPFPINPPGAARANSPVAVVSRTVGAMDVFWIGPDGAIGTTWENPQVDNANWHRPFPISPPSAARADSPLAVISRYPGALDVFWIGPDGAIGTTWENLQVNNANWHPPFPITPPGAARAGSPLAVVSRYPGALDVFWIGPDGAIGTTWENPQIDNAGWHPPFPICPPGAARADSPLGVVSRYPGAMDVFWIGPDGAIGTTWENPQVDSANWHPPFPICPAGAARANSDLAVLTRFAGAMDVFWIGPDGAIGTTWENPQLDSANWHPPFPISPPGAARGDSPLAAVTRYVGAMDVFWIGPDGAIGTTWENPQIANGAWHPPFPISPTGAARLDAKLAVVTR